MLFWENMKNNCPELSALAIKSLNTPVTFIYVERSFSLDRDIFRQEI